jgi:hypothetical protein
MNKFTKKNGFGYVWLLYYRYRVVYVGSCVSFNGDLFDSLNGKKFDGMKYKEVVLGDMLKLKRELVRKYDPVYNRKNVKRVSLVKELTLQEKLDYCRVNGISLAEYRLTHNPQQI